MTIVGGLRSRLIRDSIYEMLRAALADLGWFDEVASRSQISFLADASPPDVEVPFNTLALAGEGETGEDIELGSQLQETRWEMWVDFYGENTSLSLHLIRDVKDILQGRMPSIGRTGPVVNVYDYTLATPVVIFNVDIEDVRTDRAKGFPQPWLRAWHSCGFTVVDTYDNENVDDTPPSSGGSSGGFGGY